MAQPIYFLPDLRKSACDSLPLMRAMLRERGVVDTFSGLALEEMPVHELTGRGPDDKAGCILAYQTPSGEVPRRLGYYPKEQAWAPVGDGSLVYIGIDTAEPPKPEEMARNIVPGYPVTLGDGREWIVPVIRRSDPSKATELPRAFVRTAAGSIVEEVRSQFRPLFDGIKPLADWFYAGMPADAIERKTVYEWAITALGVNYRIGWTEQNILQLVDSDNYLGVIAAAVDFPAHAAFLAAKKKTNGHRAELSSTPGPADDSGIISQVGVTCT